MLEEIIFPSLLNDDSDFPVYVQIGGNPYHYVIMRHWLDMQIPVSGISRRVPVGLP